MNLIPLLVIIPLGFAFINVFFKKKLVSASVILTNLAVAGICIISFIIFFNVPDTNYLIGGHEYPFGITFVVDGLSKIFLVTISVVSLLVVIYAISYMKEYTAKSKFYALFLLMIAGMNGVVLTGDLFNMFVFIEIASISSYALVGFGTEHEELEASFKYIILGGIASLFILFGIGITYAQYGNLNIAEIATLVSKSQETSPMMYLALSFFILGFGLKSALIPFHAWLPDAHPSAPAPISAMLSGLLIKALGVYALIRILFNMYGIMNKPEILNILLVLGAISMVIGVILAIGQYDYKRLCAYHSISQLGYIVLALGLGTKWGILGAVFHLVNHSVFKSLLFLNAGAVEYSTGTRNVKELGGLYKKMPVSTKTAIVGSLSIAGIPPFNGFFSKVVIIYACIAAGKGVYAVLAVAASILTLASFAKVQRYAFFGKLKQGLEKVKQAPFSMKLSLILFSILCLALSALWIPEIRKAVLDPVYNVLLKGSEYVKAIAKF
jgi:multicomponent Na+:H+ antiporter subunit D